MHILPQDLDSEQETDFFKNDFNDSKKDEVSFRFLFKHGEWILDMYIKVLFF